MNGPSNFIVDTNESYIILQVADLPLSYHDSCFMVPFATEPPGFFSVPRRRVDKMASGWAEKSKSWML